MINGTLSRILYVSSAVMIVTCIIGIVMHGLTARPVPVELTAALSTCLAFQFGAHVRPPVTMTGESETQDVRQ